MTEEGWRVRGTTRSAPEKLHAQERVRIHLGDGDAEWTRALQDVEVVVHLAAQAHLRDGKEGDYRGTNTRGAVRVAQAALAAGVRRFVFMSSVGVHGRQQDETPLSEESPIRPENEYARSKWEAEQALVEMGRTGKMEISILRSPLVYGPGNPGNFLRLMHWVDRENPLPFGRVRNRRSFVGVSNVADALLTLASHPAAAGTFLVSDGKDLSTPELIDALAEALGKKPRIFGVPPGLLRWGMRLLGRRRDAERLLGSLVIDSSRIRRVLSWTPPVPFKEELHRLADWYRGEGP